MPTKTGRSTLREIEAGVPLSDCGADILTAKPERLADEVWERIQASYDEGHEDRVKEWPENWLMAFDGQHWIYWNQHLQQYRPTSQPLHLQQTNNLLIGAVAHAAAGIVQSTPAWDVNPINNEYKAKMAALMARQQLLLDVETLDIGPLSHETALNQLTCGIGIEKTWWDPDAGDVVEEYQPILNESLTEEQKLARDTGKPISKGLKTKGAIVVDTVSPWNFFFQPGLNRCTLKRPCKSVYEICFYSEAYLRRYFKLPADFNFDRTRGERFQVAWPGMPGPGLAGTRMADGMVMVAHYYQKPAPVRGFERGLVLSVCGNAVLGKPKPLQDPKGELPFDVYPWTPRPGCSRPRAWLTDLKNPQKGFNQVDSHLTTWASIACAPNLITRKGSQIPNEIPIGFQNMEIPMGIEEPKWLNAPDIPPQLFQLKGLKAQDFERIGMQFRGSFGQHQAAIPAAYYLDILKEADAIDQQPIVRNIAAARQSQGRKLLRLHKLFDTTEERRALAGANGKAQVFVWDSEALDPDHLNVSVSASSLLQYLSSSRARQILEMTDRGLFGPPGQMAPEIARQILGWINMPNLTELERPGAMWDDLAKRNHDALIYEGKPIEVDPRWLVPVLLERAVERLADTDVPEWPPEARQAFDAYFAQLDGINKQMMAAQEAKAKGMAIEGLKLKVAEAEGEALAAAKGKIAEMGAAEAFKAHGKAEKAAKAGEEPTEQKKESEPGKGSVPPAPGEDETGAVEAPEVM